MDELIEKMAVACESAAMAQRDIITQMQAVLSAISAIGTHVVVPSEPTRSMNQAAYKAADYHDESLTPQEVSDIIHGLYPRIYEAMLNARPRE